MYRITPYSLEVGIISEALIYSKKTILFHLTLKHFNTCIILTTSQAECEVIDYR